MLSIGHLSFTNCCTALYTVRGCIFVWNFSQCWLCNDGLPCVNGELPCVNSKEFKYDAQMPVLLWDVFSDFQKSIEYRREVKKNDGGNKNNDNKTEQTKIFDR